MKITGKTVLMFMLQLVGTFLFAFGTKNIFDPHGLVTGGITGLCISLKYLTRGVFPGGGFPLWLSNIILNIPIFLFTYKIKGIKYVGQSFMSFILESAWLYIVPSYVLFGTDLFLTAVIGGICYGAGTGLLIIADATSGGTDLLGYTLHHYFPHVSIAVIIQILDGIIVLTGAWLFGLTNTMYAVISIIVATKITDTMLESTNYTKMIFVISDKYKEISDRIREETDRKVTVLEVNNKDRGADRKMLYCIVTQKEMVTVRNIVSETDKKAFMSVGDAREVMGEGFTD